MLPEQVLSTFNRFKVAGVIQQKGVICRKGTHRTARVGIS